MRLRKLRAKPDVTRAITQPSRNSRKAEAKYRQIIVKANTLIAS